VLGFSAFVHFPISRPWTNNRMVSAIHFIG
jgi:hypothetical protein